MNYTMPVELQNKIDGLKQELGATQGRARAIAAKAKREDREFTSAEQSDCDRLFRRFDQIESEIADMTEEWGSTPLPRVTSPTPVGNQRQSYAPTGPQYANLFRGAPGADPYSGRFESFGSFALAVMSGKSDPRLISNTAMTEGSGAGGGFLVPPAFLARLRQLAPRFSHFARILPDPLAASF